MLVVRKLKHALAVILFTKMVNAMNKGRNIDNITKIPRRLTVVNIHDY